MAAAPCAVLAVAVLLLFLSTPCIYAWKKGRATFYGNEPWCVLKKAFKGFEVGHTACISGYQQTSCKCTASKRAKYVLCQLVWEFLQPYAAQNIQYMMCVATWNV